MNRLKGQKKEVILLQYFGDFSQKEIAAMLKITPGNEGSFLSCKEGIKRIFNEGGRKMTYRELLELYKTGELELEQRKR